MDRLKLSEVVRINIKQALLSFKNNHKWYHDIKSIHYHIKSDYHIFDAYSFANHFTNYYKEYNQGMLRDISFADVFNMYIEYFNKHTMKG